MKKISWHFLGVSWSIQLTENSLKRHSITLFRDIYFISSVLIQSTLNSLLLEMNATSVCPRSSDPFYLVTYFKTWVTTSWTDGKLSFLLYLLLKAEPSLRPRLRDFIRFLANENCSYIKKNINSALKKILCYYLVCLK